MKKKVLTAGAAVLAVSAAQAVTVFNEDFDGMIGYNVNSTTALVGDNDWVDFANRIGNNFSSFEGYATAVGGAETVLTGGATGNDPQIRSDFQPGFDKTLVDGLELRLRIDIDQNSTYDDALANANFNVFWGTDPYVNPGAQNGNTQLNFNFGAPTTLTAQADGWHVASWSITPGSLTAGTSGDIVRSLRVDPVNNNNGASFELDYLRVTAVPEPSSLALLGMGGGLLLVSLRNRRK